MRPCNQSAHCRSTSSLPQLNRSSNVKRRRPIVEALESRDLFATDLRSIDGSGNNLLHPDWGSTNEQLLRKAAAEYADGIAAAAGQNRPSARAVSNALATQVTELLNDRDLSAFIYAWGQFLDHDLDLTPTGTTGETLPISVPKGDPSFDPRSLGNQTIGLTRSIFDPATGASKKNPREQLNIITAFIDGSQIYGSDADRAAKLRTLVGGKLKTGDGDLLPYNTMGLKNDNPLGAATDSLFVAGDVRANENIELTAMHSLFLREHNYRADRIAAAHPRWTDEQIYQQARRIVVGELQAITYNEFLPALLGTGTLADYRGYNAKVNPGIANEFSTAAFRLGHSLLGDDIEFLDNSGDDTHEEVELRDAFFNPQLLTETGIDGILKYLASDRAHELDSQVVDDVRNFLFGPPGAGGFDLASLNIQRGRDHGLADYNAVRVAYGLRPVKTFADITSNMTTQKALREAYGNVNNIDLWVGGLAEDHVAGGSLGATFRQILIDQFQRLRDGDRFWYERDLSGVTLQEVRNTSLADIISRNTTTTNLQDNVFFFRASIRGFVYFDANADGNRDRPRSGVGGIEVQLLDIDGTAVATTRTGRDGRYLFDDLDLGTYSVRVSLPRGTYQTTETPTDLAITRGMALTSTNIGIGLLSDRA